MFHGSRFGPALAVAAGVLLAVATCTLPRARADALPIGSAALPGGEHVASAQRASRAAVSARAGYGHTERVSGSPAVHERVMGDLSLAYSPMPALMLGATGMARFDAHRAQGRRIDEGAAFGSALAARVRHELSQGMALAADLTVLFPPARGISRGLKATSPALRAIGTYTLPTMHVSLNAGVRFDRSRYAVRDPDLLSVNDRVSANLSDSHALLFGALVSMPIAGFVLTGEWSWDVGVGSKAPSPLASPMRLEAGVQRMLQGGLFAGALLGVSTSSRPRAAELSPIEPRVWCMLTLGFVWDKQPTKKPAAVPAPKPEKPATPAPVAAPEPTEVEEEQLPPGQIRGRVRSLRGQNLRAQIEILPLGHKVEADAKGAFVVDVPPGSYTVVVRAAGHEPQERPAEVEQNGVTILVIDLRRRKP